MTAGHTKCICDICFGLIRLRYMRCDSQCLQHLASVVNSSAVSNEVVWPPFSWYEWDSFYIEHLNVLEEFLNITISVSLLCPVLYL